MPGLVSLDKALKKQVTLGIKNSYLVQGIAPFGINNNEITASIAQEKNLYPTNNRSTTSCTLRTGWI